MSVAEHLDMRHAVGAIGARPAAFNTVRYSEKILEANGKRLLIKGTSKKAIDRFEEETEKGIKITERERIVTQINAFDLNTGEYLQIV